MPQPLSSGICETLFGSGILLRFSGLFSWPPGIQEPEQLRLHPLRGQIFENWVVSEIVKHRYNRGQTRGLSFYREKNRGESDLVIETPHGVLLLECKAAATPASKLFQGVRRAQRQFGQFGMTAKVAVAYGGNEWLDWSGQTLVPWHSLQKHDQCLPAG